MTAPAGILGVIPCRYGSTRLPGKPLADIAGRPLVWHVWNRARQAACLGRLLVATDDARILEAVRAFGGEAVMTSASHASGTDRVAEAARLAGSRAAYVANIQGDEPFLDPGLIDRVAALAEDSGAEIATAAAPLAAEEYASDSAVKVAADPSGRALYFSRSPIPWTRDGWREGAQWKHLGLYVYRREALARFVALPQSPLERLESLEPLRALEAGMVVRVHFAASGSPAVDTPEDLSRVRRLLAGAAKED